VYGIMGGELFSGEMGHARLRAFEILEILAHSSLNQKILETIIVEEARLSSRRMVV
jgi:hypothetical protein